jgi:CHAT domain-containing protein
LAEAQIAYEEALTAIEARSDQLATLVPGRKAVLGLEDVQDKLDEHVTLLSYFVLKDRMLVFLVTRLDFEVIEIDVSVENLGNRISYLYQILSLRQPDAARQAAEDLYELVITPLAAFLHTPQLAIVPHGLLHYLPFAALRDPDTEQYLTEQYTLVNLPSASALPFIKQNAVGCNLTSPLVLGNPTGDADLPSLRFAEQEARAIAAVYDVEPILGVAATEGIVREHVAEAGILHLAAHGGYNPFNPLFSTIFLAPDENYDGRLEVHEVYSLNLKHTDLVVLSACQTQLGELSAGDELVGLTRAFFFAGTPTVIASLWRVDDEATAILMERFYRHLQAGLGKAAALRQAQLDMLVDYPDPYYWAGFVLSGDGG